jgi:hypothetical protein
VLVTLPEVAANTTKYGRFSGLLFEISENENDYVGQRRYGRRIPLIQSNGYIFFLRKIKNLLRV